MSTNRNTKQKQLLCDALQQMDAFFSADDLLASVHKTQPHIGIATIYRYLRDQRSAGTLFSYVCDRKIVYSRHDTSHCHFICEKTGKVTHFHIDSLDFLKDKVPGSIRSFSIEVRGVCKEHCKTCKCR